MIYPIVRMYSTAELAAEAVARLKDWGFADDVINLITPTSGHRSEATPGAGNDPVLAALLAAYVLKSDAKVYAEGVRRGRSLVVIRAPFGCGGIATDIMDGVGTVDSGVPVEVDRGRLWDESVPLSSALWLPVLVDGGPVFSAFWSLPTTTRRGGTVGGALQIPEVKDAGPMATSFGLPTLSRKATPFSSTFGLPLLL